MRWSVSIGMCLVARLLELRLLLQLIFVSQLSTLSLPMIFMLTKTALIEGSPYGDPIQIIRRWLRRYYQHRRIQSRKNAIFMT